MIRVTDIKNGLFGLIGWEQDSSFSGTISPELTKSESGLYFQGAHPLLTLQNLACIAPAEADFSEWLTSKTKASIMKAISRFCNEKMASGVSKSLLESKTLFDGTSRIANTIKNKDNLVGFEIVPASFQGITVKINRIGLHFTEPGEYVLYLMHSSQEAPVKVIKLTKTKKNSAEWFDVEDLYLPFSGKDIDAGGSWYLCYYQSDIPAGSLAIRKDVDWSKGPCSTCSRKESLAWQAWSKYLEVHPFYVNGELTSELKELWNIDNNQYDYNTNYGLNLEITVRCDITDFILQQKSAFQDVILKQVAVDMLREFVYNANVRTNRHSINASRQDILYELDGDSSSMKKSGLNYQLDLAFKAVNFDTKGISKVCLPCKNNGLKFRSI